MTRAVALDRGRTAFAERRWTDAVQALTDADMESGLPAEDLERFSTAAFLVGQEQVGIEAGTRAHQELLAVGDVTGAARTAAWLGITLMSMGEFTARSTGWLARAGRVIEANEEPSSVEGLLMIPVGLGALLGAEPESATQAFDRALEIGERFHDTDLTALALLGQGQAKIMVGETGDGLALLDEAMVAVTAGEVSPVPAGIVYCAVVASCHRAFDLRRAQEWTVALDRWCWGRPGMVLFSGQCQMHRAQLYFLRGAWSEALEAASTAQELARRGDRNAVYGAWSQQAEIERLLGRLADSEASYREAAQSGFEPQPGLALLRLAQGDPQLACDLIDRAIDSADPAARLQLLPAAIDIQLASGDLPAARRNTDELLGLGTPDSMLLVRAVTKQCEGAVLLAEGDARNALDRLRQAWSLWQELDVPYEAARCRVLAARACEALGDADSASMEAAAARVAFAELGAGPALIELDTWSRANGPDPAGPLTPREVDVLRLVSAGKTNRVVATELYLSEKTVARHLSNMYAKLGISSRAAATAYAYEHGLA